MTVWIVNPFDNLPVEGYRKQRYWLMADAFTAAGHDVTYWTGDFSHANKKPRVTDDPSRWPDGIPAVSNGTMDLMLVPTVPYAKNVCWRRFASHVALARSWEAAARAAETIRQAARDTVLKVEASVTALLEKLLAKDVDAALANESCVAALVTDAVKGLTGSAEVAAKAKLAAALKAQLAAQKNVTVVTDETLGTGFSVKLDGGRVEHAFTGDVIAEELAKRLRPELAKLLK